MKERDRELLSALMDGEASEHELRQALKATAEDPALAATWRRYHLAQSLLHGDRQVYAGTDLRAAVAGRLDGEAPAGAVGLRGWLKPLASVAVAASVTMVTVFGWQAWNSAVSPLAGDNAVAAVTAGEQHVALGPMVVVREDGEELVMPVADATAASGVSPTADQDRLNAYMTRHAQAASTASARGFAPYARVVSMEGEQRP